MEKGKRFLFMHKDEWARMKSVGTPQQEQPRNNEYLQSLIEKSQQWINSWPDSVQGHVLKREKQREQRREKDKAFIKLFKEEHRDVWNNNESVENAKQIIFDDSCYGRQLISALLESKTYEERDAQLEFRKKVKEYSQQEGLCHNEMGNSLQTLIDSKREEEEATCKRETAKDIARINKTMYLNLRQHMKKEKDMEKQLEIEDLRLITKLNEMDATNLAHEQNMFKKDLEQFINEQKQIKNTKAFREKQEDRLIEIWKKYEDRKNAMTKKIHEDRFKKSQSTENYELVKKLHEDENSRYEQFVNKGVTALEQRLKNKENEERQKREEERKKQLVLVQANKSLEDAKRIDNIDKNICACDRQCLFPKCKHIARIQHVSQEKDTTPSAPLTNTLVQKLKVREKEPSPWSGAPAAHARFARRAAQTLRDCRYKHAARSVIDEYRKVHGLQPQELPIPDYL